MVHTIEISYVLSSTDFNYLIQDIYELKSFNKESFNLFLNGERNYYPLPSLPVGITHLAFIRDKQFNSTIYMKAVLDLQSLIYGSPTIDLFTPVYYETQKLCYAYAEAILTVFPSLAELNIDTEQYINTKTVTNCTLESLPYLILAKVTDIDYSLNLRVEENKKDMTLKCIRASYLDSKKKIQHYKKNAGGDKNYNLYAKSDAKKPSSITKVYDKQRYYDDKNIPITESLRASAENILRYEYRKQTDLKNFVAKNYKLPKAFLTSPFLLSPVTFFDYDICYKILMDEYNKTIGAADWYNDYFFSKLINNSSLTAHKKSVILNDIAPLVSIKRSIESALHAYTDGSILKNGKKIKGSASTFKKYREEALTLGIQLLRIPDRDSKKYEINMLKNPIHMIQSNRQNVKRKITLPPHIKANIDKLLQHIWLNELSRNCEEQQKAS